MFNNNNNNNNNIYTEKESPRQHHVCVCTKAWVRTYTYHAYLLWTVVVDVNDAANGDDDGDDLCLGM
jgi:hypothetical protein